MGTHTLNVTASHLLMARPRHCLGAMPSLTIASAARQYCIHTQCILNWAAGAQTGSEGQGSSEGEWMVGGMEGAMGGREGSSDNVIQGGSGSRRREGVRVAGGRFNNGTSEEGPERGMDGAREI